MRRGAQAGIVGEFMWSRRQVGMLHRWTVHRWHGGVNELVASGSTWTRAGATMKIASIIGRY